MDKRRGLYEQLSLAPSRYAVRGPLHCHIWLGATTNGYPVMRVAGKVQQTRRVLYERIKRPLLEGEVVEMDCGERLCVNMAHARARPRAR